MAAVSAMHVERQWFRRTRYELTMLVPQPGDTPDLRVKVSGRSASQIYKAIPRIESIICDEQEAARIVLHNSRRAAGLTDLAFIGRHHIQSRGVKFDIVLVGQ